LTPEGLALTEVAPGIDPAKNILPQMEFPILIPSNIPTMDPATFCKI
jgi:acyl CoA:acetate/3-ketoacid CoA transferase